MNKTDFLFSEQKYLTGQLLIASPQITDSRFTHAVILICGHDVNGAMGVIINQLIDDLTLKDLLEQLAIVPPTHDYDATPIHFGGPIEMGRGFVLHTKDYFHETSIKISNDLALSSTTEVLNLLITGKGPRQNILVLGYAGWSAGKLEAEIQKNTWLQVEADLNLVFSPDLPGIWERALNKIGVDPSLLSLQIGHA